jgi:hypothetical protein
MNYLFGELGVEVDFGRKAPGSTLQRKESDVWYDYLIDGVLVVHPFDVETLPPGRYRLVDSPVPTATN